MLKSSSKNGQEKKEASYCRIETTIGGFAMHRQKGTPNIPQAIKDEIVKKHENGYFQNHYVPGQAPFLFSGQTPLSFRLPEKIEQNRRFIQKIRCLQGFRRKKRPCKDFPCKVFWLFALPQVFQIGFALNQKGLITRASP